MRKISLIILLIITGTGLFFYINNNENLTSKDDNPNLQVSKSEDLNLQIESDDTVENNQTRTSEDQTKENDDPLPEINNHQAIFDSDPIIDAEIIYVKYNRCIDILNDNEDKFGLERYKAINTKTSKQKAYREKYQDYCDQLDEEHPEYMLSDSKTLALLKSSNSSTNEESQIINGYYNQHNKINEDFSIRDKITLLKRKNPNLLLKARRFFRNYNEEFLYPQVSELIHSTQDSYLLLVVVTAQDWYACNSGADCSLNSDLMAKYCMDRNLCANDFNDLINNHITEGIRADIALTYNYLKSIYD